MKWFAGFSVLGILVCFFFYRDTSVSVIIPCHSKHAVYLPALLQRYAEQTVLPKEVVISLSEASKVPEELLARIRQTRLPYAVKLLQNDKPLSAGENRNKACKEASGAIFLLQDADDLPHPQRVEVVRHFFKTYRLDQLLHCYSTAETPLYEIDKMAHRKIGTHEEIEPLSVTYGCPAISRKVFKKIQWRSQAMAGEDLDFVNKVCKKFSHSSAVIEAPLLVYRNELSSFRDEGK